jgi:Cytochrome c
MTARSLMVAGLLTCAVLVGATKASPPISQRDRPRQDYNSGAYLYQAFCKGCHGVSRTGDGPVADLLRRPPPDLREIATRSGGVFDREKVARMIDGRDDRSGAHADEMPAGG